MYNGGSIGLIIGCAMPNAEVAVAMSPVFIIPFMLLYVYNFISLFVSNLILCFLRSGGFFTNLDAIGPWVSWIQWISPFKWGFEAYGLNEFTGLQLYCKPDQYVYANGIAICPVETGEQVQQFKKKNVFDHLNANFFFLSQVIASLAFTSSVVWEPIFILLGIALALRVVAYIALEMQTRKALKRT